MFLPLDNYKNIWYHKVMKIRILIYQVDIVVFYLSWWISNTFCKMYLKANDAFFRHIFIIYPCWLHFGGDNFVCVNNIIIAFYKTVVKSLDVYYKKKILEVDKKRDFCPPVVEKITLLLHMQSKTIHKHKKPYNAWFFYSHK